MRKRAEMSIAEAANIIGIPRKLIDVRHGKHFPLLISCVLSLFIPTIETNIETSRISIV